MATSPNRSENINVRVTPEEKTRLQDEAAASSMKLSDYVRYRALATSTPPVQAMQAYNVLAGGLDGLENAVVAARKLMGGKD
jgi:uncharacterized protein (DUF1778 family)